MRYNPDIPEKKYLIESMEHTYGELKAWWKPNRMGYTDSIDLAGRYSFEEAKEICERAGPGNERMWEEKNVLAGAAGRIIRGVVNR